MYAWARTQIMFQLRNDKSVTPVPTEESKQINERCKFDLIELFNKAASYKLLKEN